MTKAGRRAIAFVLVLLTLVFPALGAETELTDLIQGSAAYLRQAAPQPSPGASGGEWVVLALARGGQLDAQELYAQDYLDRLEEYVAAKRGVLHQRKYTEYSRVVLALTALGLDPTQCGGYDLLAPLGDFQKIVWQGANGPAWALLALDSGSYPMPAAPVGAVQATRQMYVEELLDRQSSDGGWSLTGEGQGDPDVTGMVLQALAAYREQEPVAEGVEAGLSYLSSVQDAGGGFFAQGEESLESTAQVVVALCALGIDPATEARFQKSGGGPVDALLRCRREDGSFSHTPGCPGDQVASEQGLYALAALWRFETGQSALYDMSDVTIQSETTHPWAFAPLVEREILRAACLLTWLL